MSKIPKALVEAGIRWRQNPAAMVRELFKIEPQPWQMDVLQDFPTHPMQSMQACKGPGKALSFQTLTPTPLGTRRWGDLQVGDEIFAVDGTRTKIVARHDQGKVPLWRVTFDDGSSALACGDHQWRVRGATERSRKAYKAGRDEMWVTLTTEQIIKRGVRVKNGRWQGRQFEIPLHGAAQFPHRRQPLDPYFVGVWIGDGTRDTPQFSKPYPEVAEEIRRRGYEVSAHSDEGVYRVLGIMDEFRNLECHSCLSYQKFIPDEYKFASVAQRTDLLCGLMDTDGCIGDDSHMEYDTTSERLANDVVWLVRSLGGNALVKETVKNPTYTYAGETRDGRPCYRVTVRTPFNPFRIPHKAKRWLDPLRLKSTSRYLTRYIDRIERAGEGEAMCVEVDHPSHCYLANDFIVTHNTTVLAWLCWNFLLTRHNPNIAATSISGDNLKDGLVKEMSKWFAVCDLLKSAFVITNTRIFSKQAEKNWWMSFRTWPRSGDTQSQADTLAGLHEDNVMFVIDEAGGVPRAVLATAEAALSSCVEGHLLMAGNPTSLEGALYQAHKDRVELGGSWKTYEITGDPDDPKRAPRVSIEWARDQIRKHGKDNPWVLVNVFGKFPRQSLNVLIGEDDVREAMRRMYREWDLANASKIIGIDVARQGDDASVIARRRGLQMYPFRKYRNLNGIEGASVANRTANEFGADAIFVDGTGGFGYTWIDQMQNLGRAAIPVPFNESARDSERFYNRRSEMAFDLVDWIKNGGALPPEDSEGATELLQALTQTTYGFKGDRLILEAKEDVKAKLNGVSPDEMDAAMLTHAEPVTPKNTNTSRRPSYNAVGTYAPFAEIDRMTQVPGRSASDRYDPFGGN